MGVSNLLVLLRVWSIVPGKNVLLARASLCWADGVSKSCSISIAFSSVGATGTKRLVMASCNCLMTVSRQSVAETAGSWMWC